MIQRLYQVVGPQLYTYAASFSGALDLEDIGVEIAVEHDRYGPYGPPFVFNNQSAFVQQNPLTHAEALRGINVSIYTGNIGTIEYLSYFS